MQATINLDLHPALKTCMPVPAVHEEAQDNVIAALVEALSGSDRYELIERDGELFVQPIASARPARSTPPAFSPDARARRDAFEMAA